jgi:hypothetical protein
MNKLKSLLFAIIINTTIIASIWYSRKIGELTGIHLFYDDTGLRVYLFLLFYGIVASLFGLYLHVRQFKTDWFIFSMVMVANILNLFFVYSNSVIAFKNPTIMSVIVYLLNLYGGFICIKMFLAFTNIFNERFGN